MPETTPSPLPTNHLTIANLAVKVNAEVSNQEEGDKGAGHLMAVLLLICSGVAVSLPCIFQLGDPLGRQCLVSQVHPPPGAMGPQFWEHSLSISLNDSNFNNQDIFERTWNKGLFCIPLDCF